MALSTDLISQFVKVTNDRDNTSKASTIRGTVVVQGERTFVKMDGSDQLTPVSTTTEMQDGDRVTVTIKDHTAIATGNTTSPSARLETVDKKDAAVKSEVMGRFNEIVANYATITNLEATNAEITNLKAKDAEIENLVAEKATVEELNATNAEITNLKAKDAAIENLVAEKATVEELEATNAEITNLKAKDAAIENLVAEKATVEELNATNAEITNLKAKDAAIENLVTENLEATNAAIENLGTKYANIDFANINEAAIRKIFSDTGLIKDLVVGDSTVTGELVGVTIKGDLIEGNTVKADKLVVKGSDGLYYKLNVEAGGISAEEAPTESLHGSVITANSITAEKIRVTDLVAFGATIGGFHIKDVSLYSGVKESVKNTAPGVYLDRDGQFALGDMTNYLRYFKDENNNYKLEIVSEGITSQVKAAVDDIDVGGRNYIRNSDDEIVVELTGSEVLVDLDHSAAILECPAEEMVISFDAKSDTVIDSHDLQWGFYLQHETIEYRETSDTLTRIDGVKMEGVVTTAGNDVYAYVEGDEQKYYTIDDTTGTYYRVEIQITNPISITGELPSWEPMTTEYMRYSYSIEYTDGYGPEDVNRVRFVFAGGTGNVYIKNVKLEAGNMATDWSPAPEDVENDISAAQNTADSVSSRLDAAESMIQQLSDSIMSLVRNGENASGSLVRQDANGLYYFDIGGLMTSASDSADSLAELEGIVLDANGEIDVLKSTAAALQKQTEYVRSYTDENDQPCLELGEGDSKFKVYITNTQISFTDDTSIPAYISNQRLMIEKTTVKNELQFGDEAVATDGVWIWRKRTNGNLGLMWKGVTS